MQKFLRILMLTALLLPFALQAQNTLTVCSGTTSNEYVPFYGYYADEDQHNQLIYPASSLTAMNGQAIMQMVFYIDTSADNGTSVAANRLGTWSVSLGETSETTLSSLDNTTPLTQVYEGYFDCSTGTLTLEFDVPYNYNGGNLLVDLNHIGANWNRWFFLGTETTGASYAYDSQRNFLPQCTFTYGTPPTCLRPEALTYSFTPGNGTVTTLSWNETGTATHWQICLNDDETNLIDVTTNPYVLTGLTPETTYTAKVRAYCSTDEQSTWSSTISFTPTNTYTLTVNDGTTTNYYVPIYGLWVDELTKSQFIIPSTELSTLQFATINKLTFYAVESSVNWGPAAFNVYLSETTESTVLTIDNFSEMTQVYTGILSINNHKMEITLTTPYTYMGGNLKVGFQQTNSGNYVECNWYGVTATNASMGGYIYYLSQENFLPKTSFNFTPGQLPDCLPVTGLAVSDIAAHTATLTWSGTANSYTIIDLSDTSVVATVSDTTYNLTGLAPQTQHSFGIVANCGSDHSIMVSISFTTLISCYTPTALAYTLNPNDPTEATLSWTENGTATQWQIALNNDETNLIQVNDSIYTLHNLTPNTVYTAKVRAYCDVNDQSLWSAPISFEPTTKTVIGSGSDINRNLPTNCFYNYSLTQQIYTVAELGEAGLIESIDFYNNGDATRTRDLSVYIVNTTKDTFASATDWISVNAADLQYSGTVTFAAQTWTSIPLNGFAYTGTNNIAIIIDDNTGSYASSTPFLAFSANQQAIRIYNDYTDFDAIDPSSYNGTIETSKNQIRIGKGSLIGCHKPTGIAVNYTGGNEAVVSWTTDAATVNISINDSVTTGVTSPYTLTGLNLGTTYMVSLQAVCDSSSASDWTIPISFTTETCLPENRCQITIAGTDEYGDGWNGASIIIMQSGTQVGSFTVSSSSHTATFSVCNGSPVSFEWTAGMYDDECDFTIYDGGNAIAFTANGEDVTGTFFTMNEACPSCMPATNLTIGNTTTNSITISWTGTAASYDVYNGTTFVANVTTPSYTFTGLDAGTNYVFGIQSICSATDSSTIVTINTMTECANITTLPYHEGFEDGLGCWSTVNNSSDGQPWSALNSTVYAHSGNGLAASYSYNYGAMHADAWLISPKFVLPAVTANDNLTLSWWHRVSAIFHAELYDVMISTTSNDINAFTTTLLAVSPDSTSDYVQNTVDLTAYAGQEVYLAFHHHDSYDQNYLFIDDIELFQGGYVPPAPDSLTVTFAVNNASMGTTIPAPGTYRYAANANVSCGSQAFPGYQFVMWVLSYDGTTNTPDTIDANQANGFYFLANVLLNDGIYNITMTAYFQAGTPASSTITYAVNDATMGTISPAPGTYTIYVGDAITATAIPNTGYDLIAWTWNLIMGGTIVSSDTLFADDEEFMNPLNLGTLTQIMADYNVSIVITAIFEANSTPVTQYTVTLNTADATMGNVDPAGTTTVDENSSFTATATANTGYRFVNWIDDNGNVFTTNPYTFIVTGHTTLTATFELIDGINDIDASNVLIYANNSTIYVRGAEGHNVFVYDMNGRCIYQHAEATETENISMSSAGIYLVRIDNAIFKKVVIVK